MPRAPIGTGLSFLRSAINTHSDDCILWPFGTAKNGYGRVRVGTKVYFAHRWACIQAHGAPDDPSHEVAHNCGNRGCINPRHLRWDTRASNHADKRAHGTHMEGERCWKSILSVPDVEVIKSRLSQGHKIKDIAASFGLCRQVISDIKRHRNWKHVS